MGCDELSRVTSLLLPSRGLAGDITPVQNLTSLYKIDLSKNRLSGPLPDGFFAAFELLQDIDLSRNHLSGRIFVSDKLPATTRTLNLSSNHFYGTIPSSFIWTASELEMFDVSNNGFSGSIPVSICNSSPYVHLLDFSNNDFNGSIPHGFSNCSNLQSLRAGFSNLSGEIPLDIYRVPTLVELYLPGNKLSGSIDETISYLINLKVLALYANLLTGEIPRSIGHLSNLEQLLLHINGLTGVIPTSLANCSKLTTLNLRVNFFEGELSAFNFSKFIQLRLVDLGNNFFTGALPASLYACKKLTAIRLATNSLVGRVLPEVAMLPYLSFLSLSDNSLTNSADAIRILSRCKNLTVLVMSKNFYNEELPGQVGLIGLHGFWNLRILGLGGCRFTSAVPLWLSKLSNLSVLDLSFNNIISPIPSWIGALPNLFYLDLSNNQISGQFPVELTELQLLKSGHSPDQFEKRYLELPVFVKPNKISNLQYNRLSSLPTALYFGSNNISGSIPSEISQLKFLMVLVLNNNRFSGIIPDTMSNLAFLEILDLSANSLLGEIPASLRKLNFLSHFNVSCNDLWGEVPTGDQFDTFSSSSFEGNPGLCGRILGRSCPNRCEPRQDPWHENEGIGIDWVSFEIGFVFCFILSLLAALKFF